ncbi:MAG: ABC transporter permease [Lachnospiraceae bacterium]|nr:ABC transporter permease [Lachnospiraceae bacterium]
MNNIMTIFLKQWKDTLKNKAVLIQFLMFPVMAVLMENAMQLEGLPEHFFARLFAVMYVGMAPLVSTASIIAEEKEQNTLRALLMSNVTPMQYLFGIGSYVFLLCMIGTLVFGACSSYAAIEFIQFLLIMVIGLLLSILLGAIIGICSKNQMAATSLTVPVMLIFSFLPMLAMFNETIAKVAKYIFSQQVFLLINGIGTSTPKAETVYILAINIFLTFVLFLTVYKKKQFE